MMIDRRGLFGGFIAVGSGVLLCRAGAARAQSVQYTYDPLGRLWKVTYPDGRVTRYTYDAAGNRSQVTTGIPVPPPTLTASASPTTSAGGISYDAPASTCTASGGYAPYIYAWERVSGNTATLAFTPADRNSGGWYYTGSPVGPPKVSTWRCKVTDAENTVAYSNNVVVTMSMS
jgi:YD repeat-containing protein